MLGEMWITFWQTYVKSFQDEKIPGQVSIKDLGNTGIPDKIIKDIILPDFYHDIAELEGIYFYQSSHWVDKPHYDKKE